MLSAMPTSLRPLIKHTLIMALIFCVAQLVHLGIIASARPSAASAVLQGSYAQYAGAYFKMSALACLVPTLLLRWRSVHRGWLILLGLGLLTLAGLTAAYNAVWERNPVDTTLGLIGMSTFLTIFVYWVALVVTAVVLWLRARKKSRTSGSGAPSVSGSVEPSPADSGE